MDWFHSPLLSLPFLTLPSYEEQEVLGVPCGYYLIFTISISAFCPLSKFLQIPLFHCLAVRLGFTVVHSELHICQQGPSPAGPLTPRLCNLTLRILSAVSLHAPCSSSYSSCQHLLPILRCPEVMKSRCHLIREGFSDSLNKFCVQF